MRGFFTDGFNSFAHTALGVLAAFVYPELIIGGFVIYQITEKDQSNMAVDVGEFMAGYVGATWLQKMGYV